MESTVSEEEPFLSSPYPLSVAPMMEYTDRHYRYFMRLITRHTLLYTEMVSAVAILLGDRDKLLGFSPEEHPIALQLGGDDPQQIARAIEVAELYGYDEYNINIGCPSDKVQEGNFGACLMATPERVRDIVAAMRSATDKRVTVKHRIGIDGRERYEQLLEFVDTVDEAKPDRFTVHARIAVLKGLSPKENRNIPPLRYEDVYALKGERPHLEIEINGGIKSMEAVEEHLRRVDAVMVGRAAYDSPFIFCEADRIINGTKAPSASRREVVEGMFDYIDRAGEEGYHPRSVIRHMLGLFASQPGSRGWKQRLSGPLPDDKPGSRILKDALGAVPREVLDSVA
ncbi:MAG: tRNA dihydrouridine(20/20a) synthase DusA [Alkalispirochaetaceae bacterium]